MGERYLSAQEAAEVLAISLETLYAYVSRGLVRSEATGGSRRTRRYLAEDIQRLKERKELRQHPEKIVEQALHWGAPVLDSAITLIANGRLYYRGHDALKLATTATFEQVAGLIWNMSNGSAEQNQRAGEQLFLEHRPSSVLVQLIEDFRSQELVAHQTPLEQFQALLPLVSVEDLAAYNLRPEAVALTGSRILQLFAILMTPETSPQLTITRTLQHSWVPADEQAATLLNIALILNADNELSVSTFTARCVASTGATLYGVVQAALAALQGIRHGGQISQTYLLLRDIQRPEQVRRVLGTRLKQGEKIPGFGQPLFPEGDPRAQMLLEQLRIHYPNSPAMALALEVAHEITALLGEHPNVDFAFATLAHVLGFSADQALALFALGRCVGWIGHAIEQYQAEHPIRPRARYTGMLP